MRIMLDTNILLSASLFPTKRIDRIIEYIITNHTLVLSDLVIQEFLDVADYDKFKKLTEAKEFLKGLSFEEYRTPKVTALNDVSIRDEDDYDILFSAIKSKVDVFISRDKDFLECGVSVPRMMHLYDFESEYLQE